MSGPDCTLGLDFLKNESEYKNCKITNNDFLIEKIENRYFC